MIPGLKPWVPPHCYIASPAGSSLFSGLVREDARRQVASFVNVQQYWQEQVVSEVKETECGYRSKPSSCIAGQS